MFDNVVRHVEQTLDHVEQGNSTLVEKLEFAAATVAGIAALAALRRLGVSRGLVDGAEAVLPKFDLTGTTQLTALAKRDHLQQLALHRIVEHTNTIKEATEIPPESLGPILRRLAFGPQLDREFKVVQGDIRKIIDDFDSGNPHASGKLVVREYLQDGKLGPELKTWIQHFGGAKGGVAINTEIASKADLLINCHPNLYGEVHTDRAVQKMLLKKHVFPQAKGQIKFREGRFQREADQEPDTTLMVFGPP